MSQARNMKWLNERRVVYRQSPVNDIPDEETDKYNYYTKGTHEYYHLFNSKAKITTYKSLKWHFLVLYYLNKQPKSLSNIFRFIANKDNGFVTFFIVFIEFIINYFKYNFCEIGFYSHSHQHCSFDCPGKMPGGD